MESNRFAAWGDDNNTSSDGEKLFLIVEQNTRHTFANFVGEFLNHRTSFLEAEHRYKFHVEISEYD